MASKITKSLSLMIAGATMAGLLVGCGTSSTSAPAANSNSSSNQNQIASNGNGTHKGYGKGNRVNMVQMLEKAGASQADAQTLSQDIRQNHVQPQWVTQQLKNGVKAADIETDIQDGKAPKMTFNRNGHKGNGSNGSSNSGSGSNGTASSDSGSSSTTGSSNNSSSSSSSSTN